jgi:hypothetical protein
MTRPTKTEVFQPMISPGFDVSDDIETRDVDGGTRARASSRKQTSWLIRARIETRHTGATVRALLVRRAYAAVIGRVNPTHAQAHDYRGGTHSAGVRSGVCTDA